MQCGKLYLVIQVMRICFALRIGCEHMALGIVRYASRWVQLLAVAFGVALDLFVLFAPVL